MTLLFLLVLMYATVASYADILTSLVSIANASTTDLKVVGSSNVSLHSLIHHAH